MLARMSPHGSVADAFYAGLYAEVLARTIDGRAFDFTEDETAFVVGALAFVGRLEEASAVLASTRRWADPASAAHLRARVASRFFLGVAFSRAGRYDEAERELRENLRVAGAHDDPVCRFYVAQGLACLRYFRGLMARAARHVRRSLRHAIEARFQYGRLLATDLRGHALVQIGQVRAGLVLLEQARDLARSLGFLGNAGAIECALATYRARFGVVPLGRAVADLEALTRGTAAEDSYSRRAVETALAEQLALAGRGDEAWAKLEALSATPIPDGDGRARVRFLVACAFVARLRYGLESARTYVAEARAALGAEDEHTLEADVLCAELTVADAAERAALLPRLAQLHAATGISRAQVYASAFGETEAASAVRVSEFEEDRAGARLLRVWSAGPASLDRLVRDGYLGLVPLASGVGPEAAIVEVSPERLVLAERGNVRVLDEVPAGAARLLREIAAGDGERRAWLAKEQLVAAVWGIARYRSDRHDSLVHTAVSRLRGLLGTAGHWIESRDGAYRLAAHVAFSGLSRGLSTMGSRAAPGPGSSRGPAVEGLEAAAAQATVEPAAEGEIAAEGDAAARERMLLAHLGRDRSCSTAEVASVLKVSEMTAFRTIRGLLERGLVTRTGKARSTRYAAVDLEERRGR
jgi:Winged helix DNA-binding domain